MRRLVILLAVFFTAAANADVKDDLFKALDEQKTFGAKFMQKVTDSRHNEIAQSSGTIALDRIAPGFLMHTDSPDESVIIYKKDGIYFYDAFLNQVTISSSDSFLNSPFALIVIKDKSELEAYDISCMDKCYTLAPKRKRSDITSFTLCFKDNTLNKVSAVMDSGDINTYSFDDVTREIAKSDLDYSIPDDAEIADDR